MAFDPHGSLFSGKAALAGLIYIGASLYVTGPLIADRTIERSGWHELCATTEKAALASREHAMPSIDCHSLLGWIGPGGRELCDRHGSTFFYVPGLVAQIQSVKQTPLDLEFARSGSRCTCAARVTLEHHRTSFAVYAGTARLLAPAAIRNLRSELYSSLHSSACTIGSS